MQRSRGGMISEFEGMVYMSLRRILRDEGCSEAEAAREAQTIMREACCTAARRTTTPGFAFECRRHGLSGKEEGRHGQI